jgi:hypothetical protein
MIKKMNENHSHMISRFRWNTSFDQKERASELQERLSGWSRLNMPKEITEVFDKVCPPEQTWRIMSLEIDLGLIDFNNLEFELATKLRRQLNEKLIDLIIYANRSGRNIEILNENTSHIHLIGSFLLHGLLPWSYKLADGSVNQMLIYQLQNNRQKTITMLREVAATHENVRKRIAWQIHEPNIIKIIEGLEPNNHTQINDFANELTKIQVKETIIQTSVKDFKKNLWLWILNYLFTERGTVFNKTQFLKSSIRQMADHYNISYDELLALIEQAVAEVSKTTDIKADFLLTLKILSHENEASKRKTYRREEDPVDYWHLLKSHFRDHSLQKSKARAAEFNELVINLYKQNRSQFRELMSAVGSDEEMWLHVISYLNDASLEAICAALSTQRSAVMIESLYFLNKLSQGAGLNIKRKTLWQIGLVFLQHHKNGSFNQAAFVNYCIEQFSKKNKVFKAHLLDQFIHAQIPAAAKNVLNLDVYNSLTAAYIAELSEQNDTFFANRLDEIINRLAAQITARTMHKEQFILLQESFIRNIQLHPKPALEALIKYSDKDKLQKLFPYLSNEYTTCLLLKQVPVQTAGVILSVQRVLIGLKASTKVMNQAAWANEHFILSAALRAVLLHPRLQPVKLLEFILNSLQAQVPASQFQQFAIFIDELSTVKEVQASGISIGVAHTLYKKYQEAGKLSVVTKAARNIKTGANRQTELGKMLTLNFADREFTALRQAGKTESRAVLDYLVPAGAQLMDALVKTYTAILDRELIKLSEKEMINRLTRLYWQCIVNYSQHNGKIEALKASFKTAVLYHFSTADKALLESKPAHDQGGIENKKWQLSSENKNSFKTNVPNQFLVADKALLESKPAHDLRGIENKKWQLRNGLKISGARLFLLIDECLKTGVETITDKGDKFNLSELLSIGMEIHPATLRRIIAGISPVQKCIELMKDAVPFEQFTLWITNDVQGIMQEAMQSLRSLYQVITGLTPGNISSRMMDAYWAQAFKLIKTNSWSAGDFDKLAQASFNQLMEKGDVNTALITTVLQKGSVRLTPALNGFLQAYLPAYAATGIKETIKMPGKQLLKIEHTGLLNDFICHLVTQKQMPVWFGSAGEAEVKSLLNEIIIYHPLTFLVVLKGEVIMEQQMLWLSRFVDFNELSRSIGSLNKNHQSLLQVLAKFYNSLGNVTVRGLSAADLQFLLFSKVIKAWTSNNWRIISTESIWNELIWDACVKRGVSKKDFIINMKKIKTSFPPALQVSLESLADTDTAPAIQQVTEVPKKPEEPFLQKRGSPLLSKGGIPVMNAGMVLIASYIPLLFERLGLTVDRKFIDTPSQLKAVHYLQYVVTGLSDTEESFLPLNKVLCGLPLSHPVERGVDISEADAALINGLINAVIGYWPSIGSCSVAGLRGNWLVREGLLIEHEDKWELTVEKRAYDLLIHQSPFSFSIIKYPWMDKPLHVSWPY